jgi:hypothetical protein
MPPSEVTEIYESRSEEIRLRLFPNPVHDVLLIESMDKILKIEILNSSGIPVYQQDVYDSYDVRVNLEGRQGGLYVARITLRGQKKISCKFVIEK